LYDFKRTDAVWIPLHSNGVGWSFILEPGRERKLASGGGGWALGSQAALSTKLFFYLVDNLSLIIIMGYYEN